MAIEVMRSGQDWASTTTEQLKATLREISDEVEPGKPVVLTLTPCDLSSPILPEVQELARKAIHSRCACFGMSFSEEMYNIPGLFRAFISFDKGNGPNFCMPQEERTFIGTYLCSLYPRSVVTDPASPTLGLLNSLIMLSFSKIGLGDVAHKCIVGPEGDLEPFASAKTLFRVPEIAQTHYLEKIKLTLPPEAVFALQSASAQMSLQARFIFTWIAFEFTIGKAEQRKYFVEGLGSKVINDRIKKIRSLRASVLKNAEQAQAVRASDVGVLLEVMRLYMLKEGEPIQEHIERIEKVILRDQERQP